MLELLDFPMQSSEPRGPLEGADDTRLVCGGSIVTLDTHISYEFQPSSSSSLASNPGSPLEAMEDGSVSSRPLLSGRPTKP